MHARRDGPKERRDDLNGRSVCQAPSGSGDGVTDRAKKSRRPAD
jgi:hypothetical protein